MPIILAGRPAITLSRFPGIENEPISRKRSERLLERATAGKHAIAAIRSALIDIAQSELITSLMVGEVSNGQFDNGTGKTEPRSSGLSESSEWALSETCGLKWPGPNSCDQLEPRIAHQRIPLILPARSSCHAHPSCIVDYVGVPLPPSSILRPDPRLGLPSDVYLASPILAFLLLARKLSRAATLVCALEFCGTYDLASAFLPAKDSLALASNPIAATGSKRLPGFLSDMRPAMTPQALQSFLENLPGGARGTRTLRCAAKTVAKGSASPMESRLYALLASPARLGGYGFENIQLNVPIELAPEEARIVGTKSMRIDVVMDRSPERGLGAAANDLDSAARNLTKLPRIGIEYDSKSWHEESVDPERIRRDKKRLDIARFHGIEPLPLTWDMLRDFAVFDTFASNLMRLVGKRRRKLSDRTLTMRRALHRELFTFRNS